MAASLSIAIPRCCSGTTSSPNRGWRSQAIRTRRLITTRISTSCAAFDNLNKLDKAPHEWFRNPGRNIPSYSDKDLEERLLTWDDLEPGHFEAMIEQRGKKIRQNAEKLFGLSEQEFNALFADKETKPETESDEEGDSDGAIRRRTSGSRHGARKCGTRRGVPQDGGR